MVDRPSCMRGPTRYAAAAALAAMSLAGGRADGAAARDLFEDAARCQVLYALLATGARRAGDGATARRATQRSAEAGRFLRATRGAAAGPLADAALAGINREVSRRSGTARTRHVTGLARACDRLSFRVG